MKILLEILIKNQNMENNIIFFILAILVNISNRNLLKNVEDNKKDKEEKKQKEKKDNNFSSSFSEEENKISDGGGSNRKEKDEEKGEDKKDDDNNDNVNNINIETNPPDLPPKKNFIYIRKSKNKSFNKNKILLRNNSIKDFKNDMMMKKWK